MDVTVFETQSYFTSSQTPLQGKSQNEEDFFAMLTVPTPMPGQEKQQLTNKSPTEPTDKSFVPPMEELKV